MNPVQVLHFIDTYRIGGPGKTIINSARYIDRQKYRVHVASFTSLDDRRNEFATAVKAAGIPHLPLLETRRYNASHLTALRRYIAAEGIAVLHTHGYRTDVMGYMAVLGLRASVVTTHHGWIRNNWRQHAFTTLARQLCRALDGIEIVSEHMRCELPASIRHDPRVAVVHNAIVPEDYAPTGLGQSVRATLGLDGNHTLLAVVGRLSVEKGGLEIIESFALLRARLPAARLLFVGEGPLEAEMRSLITAREISDCVTFVGHQRDVRPFFEAADIVVSPSRTEGLSNVLLETLVSGRPVVATRVGGNSEILGDDAGVLVEPGSVVALADAIYRVATDSALRQRMVTAGERRVRRQFSFEARMKAEERFYDEVRGRAGARRGGTAVQAS